MVKSKYQLAGETADRYYHEEHGEFIELFAFLLFVCFVVENYISSLLDRFLVFGQILF
jgi:hypothetical protein